MIEFIGYVAGILTPCTMIPQIVKSTQTREVEDISNGMLTLYIINAGMWVVYGIGIDAIPLEIADSVALLTGLLQVFIKVKYRVS